MACLGVLVFLLLRACALGVDESQFEVQGGEDRMYYQVEIEVGSQR